jgi:hypothetical protein
MSVEPFLEALVAWSDNNALDGCPDAAGHARGWVDQSIEAVLPVNKFDLSLIDWMRLASPVDEGRHWTW